MDEPCHCGRTYPGANHWGCQAMDAYEMGFKDGRRDEKRGIASPIPKLEMTDYAHGYWAGRKDEKARRT